MRFSHFRIFCTFLERCPKHRGSFELIQLDSLYHHLPAKRSPRPPRPYFNISLPVMLASHNIAYLPVSFRCARWISTNIINPVRGDRLMVGPCLGVWGVCFTRPQDDIRHSDEFGLANPARTFAAFGHKSRYLKITSINVIPPRLWRGKSRALCDFAVKRCRWTGCLKKVHFLLDFGQLDCKMDRQFMLVVGFRLRFGGIKNPLNL